MSGLWHIPCMLWYCDMPLVLWNVTGIMVYVRFVAYAMYVKVL